MKHILSISLFFILTPAFGQDLKSIDKKLIAAFDKINYWAFFKTDDEKINPYDSLEEANNLFESLLLKYTSSNSQTISYSFKSLADSGLTIVTSEDGLFRIYSWDTWTGGTMHNFRNVFQYKTDIKVFSKIFKPKRDEEGDPGCFYNQVDDIISGNKKFYITQSRAVLSSGLSYHKIKIFSIDNSKLNDTAKLIKTNTSIKNQLGYEVDLTASSNRDRDVPDFYIEYDKANKIISIPVILEDSKVTNKKIRYQFKDKYFEKL
ncbi:MAG: uncharacterized protein JWN83_3009 [Chitinophagaceae bacterium]|nr:uncharacterized protein [Chitinophagaceae bacterium]